MPLISPIILLIDILTVVKSLVSSHAIPAAAPIDAVVVAAHNADRGGKMAMNINRH